MIDHIATAYQGYEQATLQTTLNGLEMILSLLKDMEAEPHEASLRYALIEAIERALDR